MSQRPTGQHEPQGQALSAHALLGRLPFRSWARALFDRKISIGQAVGAGVVLVAGSWLVLLLSGRTTRVPEGPARPGLGIQELVRGVKEELSAVDTERRRGGEVALFRVKDFDLEVSFVAHSASKGHGGFEYHVLTLDREEEVGSERVQKLHLHFEAIELPPGQVAASSSRGTGTGPVIFEGPTPPPKKRQGGIAK